MQSPPNRRYLAICLSLLFSLSLINYLDRVALSVAAKDIAADFHLTPVEMGYFFSSFLWTYVVCVVPAGMLADRYGSRKVAGAGIALWSLATVCTGLVTGLGSIIATRLAMGAGEATSYPAANRLIREQVPAAQRGFATAVFNSGAYAGPAFGAVLIAWVISLWGWRVAFIIAGLTGFVWLVLWQWFFKHVVPPHPVTQPAMQARTPEADHAALHGEASGLGILLRSESMWGTALTMGTSIYALYFLLTWLPTYLQTSKGLDIKQAGFVTAIPYIGSVILGIFLGRLSDRFLEKGEVQSGRRRPMIAVMLLCSSVILLTPFVQSLWVIVLLFTVSLTGIATAGSLNMALANDLLVDARDAAKANSLVVLGGNAFGIIAPIATGYIIQATGSYDYAFIVAGGLLVVGAILSQVMTRQPIGAASKAGGRSAPRTGEA